MLFYGHKLGKISERNWVNEMSSNLVYVTYIGMVNPWLIFRNDEGIYNIVASQTENMTRIKDWMMSSHGLFDRAQILWRVII
jgi:hypothetical protein